MKKLTYKESEAQARVIKQIMNLCLELDINYLTEALEAMRKNHSFKESAAVLNPSPFIHNEKQALESVKLNQLDIMLKLANNSLSILECQLKLTQAEKNSNNLKKMF